MKKLLPLLALVLTLPAHAALVQWGHTATNAGSSPSVTLTASASGSAIIVIAMAESSAFSGVPTDNESNEYTVTGISGAGYYHSTVWYVCNATAGVTSVTLHNTTAVTAIVVEESGLAAMACYDQHAAQMTTGPSWTSGNTAALTQASEVAFGFVDDANSSNISATAGTDWTEVGQATNTSTGPMVMFVQRQAVSSTSAIASAGGSSSGGSLDGGIATFEQSGSPPPSSAPPQPSPFAIGASLLPRGVDLASFAH